MEMKRALPFLVLALMLTQVELVAANPFTDFFDSITGAVTRTFEAVHKFLIKIEIVFLNIVEVLLFLVFIFLLVVMFVVPARVYAYAKEFSAPFKRFFDWVRK
jgi:hypothetical protein